MLSAFVGSALSAPSVHPDREAQIEVLKATPGITWKAAPQYVRALSNNLRQTDALSKPTQQSNQAVSQLVLPDDSFLSLLCTALGLRPRPPAKPSLR